MLNYLNVIKLKSCSVKYFKIYEKIIHRAYNRNKITSSTVSSFKRYVNKKFGKYVYEAHHILPKCLGDDKSKKDINNIVFLTIKEHLICHKILALRCIKNNTSILQAYYAMFSKRTKQQKYRTPFAKEVEIFKANSNKLFSRSGNKNGMFGKTHNEDTKQKISISNKGRKRTKKQILKLKQIGKINKEKTSWYQLLKYNPNILCKNYTEFKNNVIDLYKNKNIKNFTEICKRLNLNSSSTQPIKSILVDNKIDLIPENIRLLWSKIYTKYKHKWQSFDDLLNCIKISYNKVPTISNISSDLGIGSCLIITCLKHLKLDPIKDDKYWIRLINKYKNNLKFKNKEEFILELKKHKTSNAKLAKILGLSVSETTTAIQKYINPYNSD